VELFNSIVLTISNHVIILVSIPILTIFHLFTDDYSMWIRVTEKYI